MPVSATAKSSPATLPSPLPCRQANGAAVCWGRNAERQAAPPIWRFQTLSAGDTHTCGVESTRARVVCWGRARTAPHDRTLTQVRHPPAGPWPGIARPSLAAACPAFEPSSSESLADPLRVWPCGVGPSGVCYAGAGTAAGRRPSGRRPGSQGQSWAAQVTARFDSDWRQPLPQALLTRGREQVSPPVDGRGRNVTACHRVWV